MCRDGERLGYDENYIQEMSRSLSVPLIACGGARDYDDLVKLANNTEADSSTQILNLG